MKDVTNWQRSLPENSLKLPKSLKNFMQQPSLTVALNQCTAPFDVELRYLGFVNENQQSSNIDEICNLTVFVREVFLRLNQTPVVWAISTCHQNDTFWQPILNRGNQPLGTFLFEDQSTKIERTELEFSYKKHKSCPENQQLWSRRSTFKHHLSSLNLQEVFLPALLDFI